MTLKHHIVGIACACATAFAAASHANAIVVNFDDLVGNNTPISPGSAPYKGFVWGHFNVTDGTLGPLPGNTGVGVVSPKNVAVTEDGFNTQIFRANADVNSDADQFDVVSFFVTAYPQQPAFDLNLIGSNNGSGQFFDSITVSSLGPTLMTLNWTGIDQIDFVPVDPSNHNKAVKGFFTLDDVNLNVPQVSPVPLPATLPLFLGGLGILAFGKTRRALPRKT